MVAKKIDPERAKELLEGNGYVFVDVRTPEEFTRGHVPGARNVPFMVRGTNGAGIYRNQSFLEYMQTRYERDARIIVGCQKGGRSTQAADLLSESGYNNVFDMRGGFVGETDPFGKVTFPGWCSKGYPVSTDSKPDERYRTPRQRV